MLIPHAVVAGTGHRPDRLGGYSQITDKRLVRLCSDFLNVRKYQLVITGMALGFDMALAEAAYDVGVPFIAAIPFKGQESRWPDEHVARYKYLLDKAQTVKIVSFGTYSSYKFITRDRWMVERAMNVVALWNGDPNSGTGQTVAYAHKINAPVDNLWQMWQDHYANMTI